MNASKQQYITTIRANTSYPTYRGIIGIITKIGYIISGILALAGILYFIRFPGATVALFSIVASPLIFLGARFWKEAALILADIADSITDANSRGQ
jgi:hypothetical protein